MTDPSSIEIPICSPDTIDFYLREVASYRLLDRQEVKVLAARIHECDLDAHREMVLHHLRLPIGIWKKEFEEICDGTPRTFCSMINAGNQSMVEAAKKYDPERGYKFSTYVVHWIRVAMERDNAALR